MTSCQNYKQIQIQSKLRAAGALLGKNLFGIKHTLACSKADAKQVFSAFMSNSHLKVSIGSAITQALQLSDFPSLLHMVKVRLKRPSVFAATSFTGPCKAMTWNSKRGQRNFDCIFGLLCWCSEDCQGRMHLPMKHKCQIHPASSATRPPSNTTT